MFHSVLTDHKLIWEPYLNAVAYGVEYYYAGKHTSTKMIEVIGFKGDIPKEYFEIKMSPERMLEEKLKQMKKEYDAKPLIERLFMRVFVIAKLITNSMEEKNKNK